MRARTRISGDSERREPRVNSPRFASARRKGSGTSREKAAAAAPALTAERSGESAANLQMPTTCVHTHARAQVCVGREQINLSQYNRRAAYQRISPVSVFSLSETLPPP